MAACEGVRKGLVKEADGWKGFGQEQMRSGEHPSRRKDWIRIQV